MSTQSAKRILHGGCHCGHIKYKFEAQPDPTTGNFVANRCNCTFCQKLSTTNLPSEPEGFTLLSPASIDEVANYAPRINTARRNFCQNCGVHVWMSGYYEYQGTKVPLFLVNLATVDQPQEGIELSEVKIKYIDMLHDNFGAGLKDEPWKGGLP